MAERLTRDGRVKRLVWAWVAYWLTLVTITVGRALGAAWRLSRPGAHGNASLGFDDGKFFFTIVRDGATLWTASVTITAVALWLVVPPLLMWVIWLARSSSGAEQRIEALGSGDAMEMPNARSRENVRRN